MANSCICAASIWFGTTYVGTNYCPTVKTHCSWSCMHSGVITTARVTSPFNFSTGARRRIQVEMSQVFTVRWTSTQSSRFLNGKVGASLTERNCILVKFTQEYLSHGPVLYTDSVYKQARIDDLIKDGLYEIFPEFEAPGDHIRAGLYTLQVICRKAGYPPAKGIIRSRWSPEASSVPTARPSMSAPSPNAKISKSRASKPKPKPKTKAQPNANTPKSRASKPKTNTKVEPLYSYDNCEHLVPMTVNLLNTVRKVTMNFRLLPE
jgi:hypothetical protein